MIRVPRAGPVPYRATAIVLVAAGLSGNLVAQALPTDVRTLVAEKVLAEQQVADARQRESSSQDALEQAKKAETLAREANDDEALGIANQAVEIATRSVEKNKSDLDAALRALTVINDRGRALCGKVELQVKSDLEAIARQMRSNEASQRELETWTRLNDKAQKEALLSGVRFMIGSHAADMQILNGKVLRLQSVVDDLTRKAAVTGKAATRLKLAKQLEAVRAELLTRTTELQDKVLARYIENIDKGWEFARNGIRSELRSASKNDEPLRNLLTGSEWKDAFLGDDIDSPGLDGLSRAVEEALTYEGHLILGLKRFEEMLGPAIRAAAFMRDALYNALLSYESTERVLQQSDVAGLLAIAAGKLQTQYQNSIDARELCQAAGYLR